MDRTLQHLRGTMGITLTRREFFHLHCDEDGDLEEHIRKLRELQNDLHAMGSEIPDTEFVNSLLTSLPDSWDQYITALQGAGNLTSITSHSLI
jgi:hypothetical protein